jgi:hypothetical protein
LAFATFILSGGREMFLLGFGGFFVWLSLVLIERREGGNFVELVASNNYFFVSRRACTGFCSSWAFEVSWRSLAVFCWRGGDRELFC